MQECSYRDQTFQAYKATPKSGQGNGVLVCHAWWGLTDVFINVCNRLAAEGFVALAPDIFHGKTARTIEEAKSLRSQVNRSQAKKEVRAALDCLQTHSAVVGDCLGAIGFSYGCSYAMEAARLRPKVVKAVALFYGTGGGKLDKTQAVFQGHFAEKDEWGANPAKAKKLEERIRREGQEAEFYIYPGVAHWFFEENNEAYNREAAELAWQRCVTFLREHLC
jgi:carboxymethylenebutenolidase